MKSSNVLQRIIFAISLAMTLVVTGCTDNILEPLEHNSAPLGTVSNVTHENQPGGATITYTLPDEQDLLYVKAEYTLATGQKMQVKSSFYNNSLAVEGFADTKPHVVTLYAVNRSETVSEPVQVTITPLESPIWAVMRSLGNDSGDRSANVKPAFAGVYLHALNLSRANVAILVMEKNDKGDWTTNPNSIYTTQDTISKTIRGLSIEPHHFAITVRDRWLNTTDTIYKDITPFPEVELDKSKFGNAAFPGDTPHWSENSLSGMWDGDILNWPKVYVTHPSALTTIPQHVVTIDTGVLIKMSRIKIWDYPEYKPSGAYARSYYNTGNLKDFVIYGWPLNTPPTEAGFDGWVPLGHFHEVKPSGLPLGQMSTEDYNAAAAGFSWDFDPSAPAVRYLRLKSLSNWEGLGTLSIAEIKIYGAPAN